MGISNDLELASQYRDLFNDSTHQFLSLQETDQTLSVSAGRKWSATGDLRSHTKTTTYLQHFVDTTLCQHKNPVSEQDLWDYSNDVLEMH